MVSDVLPPSNSPVLAFIQHPGVFVWGLSVEDFVLWNWEVICSWDKQQPTRNAVQYFKNVPLSFFMWLDLTSVTAVTETPSARTALECGCLWLFYTHECVNMFLLWDKAAHCSLSNLACPQLSLVGHLIFFLLCLPLSRSCGLGIWSRRWKVYREDLNLT